MTVPNLGWIHSAVCAVTDALLKDPRVTLMRPRAKPPYENNLAQIRLTMLHREFDWWLNIDADNPPMKNPLELIEYDLPLTGLPTPVWVFTDTPKERPICWNAYKYLPDIDEYTEWNPKEGLQQVDAIGAGCFLARRDLMEVMDDQPFVRRYDKEGRAIKGADIAFCEKIRAKGLPIHAHFDYPCRHFHEIDLVDVSLGYQNMKMAMAS